MSLEDFTDVDESDEAAAADESVPSRSDPDTEVEPDDDFEEYSVAVDGEDVGLGALSVAQGLRVSEEADDTTLRAFVVTGNRDSVRLGKYLLVPYPDDETDHWRVKAGEKDGRDVYELIPRERVYSVQVVGKKTGTAVTRTR